MSGDYKKTDQNDQKSYEKSNKSFKKWCHSP